MRLSPGESRHLVTVNRARRGDPVTAFDGGGTEFDCILSRADGGGACLEIRDRRTIPPLPYSLTLAQALPKGKTFDTIVRQATEIGAARILPLITEQTEARPPARRLGQKSERWQSAAIEAAKQCGNPFLPEIGAVCNLREFLTDPPPADLKLLAGLVPETRPLRDCFPSEVEGSPGRPFRVLWLVGPEGDFTAAEVESAQVCGFHPVSLGPYVLRVDTAALCALSITVCELRARTG